MRNWLKRFEVMAAAVAFAEEGEWQEARGILNETQRKPQLQDQKRKQPGIRVREHSYRV
ncbi:hypothetical protein [Desulfomonile tiedjei]|uniref:Uncharacterized protein n=1 Tax=Desulfomonile tiedjei (strain ATCC 49306 / DSM 6799 / DCB-1) TaxID=706587 RepID=I4C1K1_DESTA|nr:hypothetical protein [Desulfomonile tiedjei]AFM23442.1 hypothetical protein Desti_0716 [Desulfomonile tiedjei DSM 6799]